MFKNYLLDFLSGHFSFVVCTTSMEGDLVVGEIAQPPPYCTVNFMNFFKSSRFLNVFYW